MIERPILFSAPMVRAILDGRKFQTRRVIKLPPQAGSAGLDLHEQRDADGVIVGLDAIPRKSHGMQWGAIRCPYGVPGETRLWVRETWGTTDADAPGCPDGRKPQQGDRLCYRADPADDYQWGAGLPSQGNFVWRPSIHMPRWASRILLELTEVRVQRVAEISTEDAVAEGFEMGHPAGPIHWFQGLWDSINAERGFGWDTNPFVWCLTFKRIEPGPRGA